MTSISNCLAQFAASRNRESLLAETLGRIADPSGQGARAFLKVATQAALDQARLYDGMQKRGETLPPFAGVPVSIKDLFDVEGDVTASGSTLLRDAPPATKDAVAVARLKAAGFIPIGRTNMTEFAFSGLGINPHYGTPLNAYDRKAARIPGGSSSGAAVSVTDKMAYAALGTDTGGSCRIPAALCGLVGFKPTAVRVPQDGVLPLSSSLDSVGTIANSVACCTVLDTVLACEDSFNLSSIPLERLRLAVPQTLIFDDIDNDVGRAFARAQSKLSDAGVQIIDIPLRELAELQQINAKGGFGAAESYAFHRPLIAAKHDLYDPRVLSRILRGKEQSAADYIDLLHARADFIRRVQTIVAPYDALLMPTVPIVAPRLCDLKSDDVYRDVNLLMLRNPTVANFLDGCSISIPCHERGDAPVGLMLIGQTNGDARILTIAAAIERLIAPKWPG